MADRTVPYGAFRFTVKFNNAESPFGGFSDVSGLSSDITVAEYRNGNEKTNYVHKIPGMHKVSDVTLKRGVINSEELWKWITEVRQEGYSKAKDSVSITLEDETQTPVQTWTLNHCIPLKYTGPTLAAKGGGDVAIEELVISAEDLVFKLGA